MITFLLGFRELARARLRCLVLALLFAMQVTALAGQLIGFESLVQTRNTIAEELRLADLTVSFTAVAATDIPSLQDLEAIPGVAAAARRFEMRGYIEREPEGTPLPVLIEFLERGAAERINRLRVLTGPELDATAPSAALVDRNFFAHSRLAVGDQLVVNPHAFPLRFTVAGSVLSPEHFIPLPNPDLVFPDKSSLGVIFASRAQLDQLFVEPLYNQLTFRFQPGADPAQVTASVLSALDHLEIRRALPRQATLQEAFIDRVLDGYRVFTPIAGTIIGLLAALVAAFTTHRVVTARRAEIATLMAQGWPRHRFLVAYSLLGIAPGVVGALLGMGGALWFAHSIAGDFAASMGFPTPLLFIPRAEVAFALLSAPLLGLIASWVALARLVSLTPIEALRGRRSLRIARLPGLLETALARFRAPTRYALRNLTRHPMLSLATPLVLALAIAMPASILTSVSSWQTWIEKRTAVGEWDAQVTFKVPLDAGQLRPLLATRGLQAAEPFVLGFASLQLPDGRLEEVRVRGLSVPEQLHHLPIAAGRYFSSPHAAEIVLNTALSAGRVLPELGDSIALRPPGGAPVALTVVGLVADATVGAVWIPRETAQELFGRADTVSGIYVRYGADARHESPLARQVQSLPAPPAAHAGTLKARLYSQPMVLSVEERTDSRRALLEFLGAIQGLWRPFLVLGAVVACLFLFCVLGYLLAERELEYSTLRALGYGRREITRLVFSEIAVLLAIGLLFTWPAWIAVSQLFLTASGRAWIPVPLSLRWQDLAPVLGSVLLVLPLSVLPGILALLRASLSKVLRERVAG
jgi:putative ABC transport system permease protein